MKYILRMEQLFLFLLTIYIYIVWFDFSWILLLVLLFTPDISMVGYLLDTRKGAMIYNIVHSLITPCVLFALGWFLNYNFLIMYSLILFAHIFLDRALDYGLKYGDSFKHTHLTEVE